MPHSGGVERQTDGKNNGAGHQGREELSDLPDENAEQNGHHAARDFRAQDGGQIKLPADGQEGGHIGKADAHNHRQAGADAAGDGVELNQGGNRGDQQGNLNEQGPVGPGQAAGVGYHDSGGDDAHNGGYHMLEPQGNQLPRRGNAAQREHGAGGGGLGWFHVTSPHKNFLEQKNILYNPNYSPFHGGLQGEVPRPGVKKLEKFLCNMPKRAEGDFGEPQQRRDEIWKFTKNLCFLPKNYAIIETGLCADVPEIRPARLGRFCGILPPRPCRTGQFMI